jgi:hypothetical protein
MKKAHREWLNPDKAITSYVAWELNDYDATFTLADCNRSAQIHSYSMNGWSKKSVRAMRNKLSKVRHAIDTLDDELIARLNDWWLVLGTRPQEMAMDRPGSGLVPRALLQEVREEEPSLNPTIKAEAGYGHVLVEADRDTALALLALLASMDSDGSVSVLSNPRGDGSVWRIEIHMMGPNRRRMIRAWDSGQQPS